MFVHAHSMHGAITQLCSLPHMENHRSPALRKATDTAWSLHPYCMRKIEGTLKRCCQQDHQSLPCLTNSLFLQWMSSEMVLPSPVSAMPYKNHKSHYCHLFYAHSKYPQKWCCHQISQQSPPHLTNVSCTRWNVASIRKHRSLPSLTMFHTHSNCPPTSCDQVCPAIRNQQLPCLGTPTMF